VINPNVECRNPKQYQMTKIQNPKHKTVQSGKLFGTFGYSDFEFVSDFDIRISDLNLSEIF